MQFSIKIYENILHQTPARNIESFGVCTDYGPNFPPTTVTQPRSAVCWIFFTIRLSITRDSYVLRESLPIENTLIEIIDKKVKFFYVVDL